MRENFYAVILSGGSGERFWPLSTPDRPKQFLTVFGGKSLLRQAVDRLDGLVPKERILIITGTSLVKATLEELPELPRENVVAEPCRRDTAAAVATACGVVAARGGEKAVAAILTADHLMNDEEAFRRVLADAAEVAAGRDCVVTMGVEPNYPATGFGYIRVGEERVESGTATEFRRAKKFVEKPQAALAKRYLKSGKYVWNAGMFVWRVETMRAALAKSGVEDLWALEAAVSRAKTAEELARTLEEHYRNLGRISIDYAVMEKIRNIVVSRSDFGWDDVGTWSSTDKHLATDARRNTVKGNVALLDVSGTVAIAEGPHIAALGVENLVIVTTKDAVLVAAKDRVQDLKKLLEQLNAK